MIMECVKSDTADFPMDLFGPWATGSANVEDNLPVLEHCVLAVLRLAPDALLRAAFDAYSMEARDALQRDRHDIAREAYEDLLSALNEVLGPRYGVEFQHLETDPTTIGIWKIEDDEL